MQPSPQTHKLTLSPVVAGMWRMAEWQMSLQQRLELIESCLDMGITSFDHADIYGDYQCEQLFGEVLNKALQLRAKMQIISKCGIRLISKHRPENKIKRYDTSYQHIIHSAENSLRQLNTDYLDCLLIHRPDPLMDASEVGRAFTDLIASGKILSAGVSNFLPHQLALLQSCCDFSLVTNQIEVSVLQTQSFYDGSLDYCQQNNMLPMAWSPLAGGRLFKGETEQSRRVNWELTQIASEHNVSLDQVALAWLLRHPAGIKPVVGSGNVKRIRSAVQAINLKLDDEQWFTILQASAGHGIA